MATAFTPYASLLGGVLIGLASTFLMLTLGRIAGATGILSGFLMPSKPSDWAWRASFLAGMVSAPLLVLIVTGRMPSLSVPVAPLSLIIGGILVGIGVTLGGGCTSGHGVCGLARFSRRSLAATATFMVATAITVFVTRHGLGG